MQIVMQTYNTLPKFNIFAPENGWFEDDRFLLGFGLFSGAFAVSFRECNLGEWSFLSICVLVNHLFRWRFSMVSLDGEPATLTIHSFVYQTTHEPSARVCVCLHEQNNNTCIYTGVLVCHVLFGCQSNR